MMHLLIDFLPLLSLAALASALPATTTPSSSTSPLVWSKVNTAKTSSTPSSSTSPLVWSKVNTAKPTTTTSPLVWSKVLTSSSSTPSPSYSSSPLVWSKVITTKASYTSTSATKTTTTSTSRRPLPSNLFSNPAWWRQAPDGPLVPMPAYMNYGTKPKGPPALPQTTLRYYYPEFYLSGEPCKGVELPKYYNTVWAYVKASVSEEFAERHGGIDAVCGKMFTWTPDNVDSPDLIGSANSTIGIVTHTCSSDYCPGESIGLGGDYHYPSLTVVPGIGKRYQKTPEDDIPIVRWSPFKVPSKVNVPVNGQFAWTVRQGPDWN